MLRALETRRRRLPPPETRPERAVAGQAPSRRRFPRLRDHPDRRGRRRQRCDRPRLADRLVPRSGLSRRGRSVLTWTGLTLLFLAGGCAPGRSAPPGVTFPRAAEAPRLRAERVMIGSSGEVGVGLPRLAGTFRVVSAGAHVGVPYASVVVLERATRERVRLLIDHQPGTRLPIVPGEQLNVRFATRRVEGGVAVGLMLRDVGGGLRYLAVVRPPDASPFAFESELPPPLRPEASEELVYVEVRRDASYCIVERGHYRATLVTGEDRRASLPGSLLLVPWGGETYRLHVADVARVSRTDCPTRPPALLAYEVFGPEPR